jgi:hypothetical protein
MEHGGNSFREWSSPLSYTFSGRTGSGFAEEYFGRATRFFAAFRSDSGIIELLWCLWHSGGPTVNCRLRGVFKRPQ